MQKKHSLFRLALQSLLAGLLIFSAAHAPQALADSKDIKQCVKGSLESGVQCAGDAAKTAVSSAAVIGTALDFMATYPGCVNDVINLNWVTMGITGAISGLGIAGLIPVNSPDQCKGAIYGVASTPIAQGISALGLGGAGLDQFLAGQAKDSFEALAGGIPMPSVGAPYLSDQIHCGCGVASTGAKLLNELRDTMILAKQTVKSCGGAANKALDCGGQVLKGLVTDPAGTVAGVGGAIVEEVADVINYIGDGGCKNPTTAAFFESHFAPHVSATAYSDVSNGDGIKLDGLAGKGNELYRACYKYFDDCASGAKDAERRCQAALRGDAAFGNDENLGGRGFYQLNRGRRFEYEISRALYEVATPIYAQVETVLADKRGKMPKLVRDEFNAVDKGTYQIGKLLGVYDNSQNKNNTKLIPDSGTKMSWQGGSIGDLMSQRATEISKEGAWGADATNTRQRAKEIAEEYNSKFEVASTALKQIDAEFYSLLNKKFVNGGCAILEAGTYSCPNTKLHELCLASAGHVTPAINCELDWKTLALKQMEKNKGCSVLDKAAPKLNCETIVSTETCVKAFDKLGKAYVDTGIKPADICQFDFDAAMAKQSECKKSGGNFICESVASNNSCQGVHKYAGKQESRCKIDTTVAMKDICPLQPSSGLNQPAMRSYLCVTYPKQQSCRAVFEEAGSSKAVIDITCQVDVVKADAAAGAVAVQALSTPSGACTHQGAVVTCPRDVQKARCANEAFIKACELKRPSAYDALVKQAQQVRPMLLVGFDFKGSGTQTSASVGLPMTVSAERNAPSRPASGRSNMVKDIPGIALFPTADPLLFYSYDKVPADTSKINAALKTHYPNIVLSSCTSPGVDEFGLAGDKDGLDVLTLCILGSYDASLAMVKKITEEKTRNLITQPGGGGGGKAPAAVIASKIDPRINLGMTTGADIVKGGDMVSNRAQTVGGDLMNAQGALGALQRGGGQTQIAGQGAIQGVQTIGQNAALGGAPVMAAGALQNAGVTAQQRGAVGAAGAPSMGVGIVGMPAAPGMAAQVGGMSAGQLGNTPGMGANLPGAGGLAAGMGAPQQQAMMGVAPPPGAPPAPPAPGAQPARGLPTPAPPAREVASASSPHQQLTAANCTGSTAGRDAPPTLPPADGAYTCSAGAALTLCEGLVRSQPTLVKRCTQASPARR